MDYGMPTLIETRTTEECVALCKELKLDFIELNMNLPQYQSEEIDIDKLTRIREREGIYFTIHLDENLNVCDFNRRVANAYTDTVLSTIEIAKALHMPVLNLHMSEGVYFTLPTKKVYLFDAYREYYLNELLNFRNLCEKAIGNVGMKLCIENTGWEEKNFLTEGIETLLLSDVFALTLDTGHDHSDGGFDGLFITNHCNKLSHMHVHDALGKKNHLPLGAGEIDLKEKLALAEKYNCRVVLETKTIKGLKESVTALSKYKL